MPLGLNHLNEHKFKHGFNDTINLICICGGDIESISNFFLYCPEYCEASQTLFNNIQNIDKMLLSKNESSLTHLLLYGDPKLNFSVNAFILNLPLRFFLSFIFDMAFCLFLFIYSVLLSVIYTYIPGVCNVLRLVLLIASFVAISFLFS